VDTRKTVLAFLVIALALPLPSCFGDPNSLSKDQVAVYRAVLKHLELHEVSIQTIPFGDPLFRDDVGSCAPGIHLLTPSIVKSSHRLTPDVLPGREWSLVDPAHHRRRCDSPTSVSEILFDRLHRHALLGTAKEGWGELYGYVYVLEKTHGEWSFSDSTLACSWVMDF
jgi:hypothetical protein